MFPLHSFLLQMESDGIRLTTRDYQRIARVLSCQGDWSIQQLREVLTSLLAKDFQQREILQKRFDVYFDTEIQRIKDKNIDLELLLAELQTVNPIAKPTTFRSVRTRSSIKTPKKLFSKFEWSWLLLLGFIALRLFFEWNYKPQSSTELNFEINSPGEQLFATVDEEDIEKFILSTSSLEKIKIKTLILSGKDKEEINIKSTDCIGAILSREKDCQVKFSFLPQVKGNKKINLEVQSSLDNHVFKLEAKAIEKINPNRNGTEQSLDNLPIETISPQWPAIKQIKQISRLEQDKWKELIGISTLLLMLTIIFAIYLWKYRQPPKDSKPEWDSELPRHFPLEKLGGQVASRLDDETLFYLADCMGYFRSELSGHQPDINASVRATVDQGGIPSLVFQTGKQLRHLIILVDDKVSALGQLNPVAEELRVGMQRLGVSLLFGRFFADPAQFFLEDGQTCYLDDFEAERKAYLLIIFSEGLGLRDSQSRYTLEVLARWPQVAWMVPCLDRYRSSLAKLPALVGIPQYTASASGLLQAFTRFLTECAPRDDDKTKSVQLSSVPIQGDVPLAVYLETQLGKALPWAQACAMIQPLTFGLADVLRREYFAYLPAENIEHIVALPGTALSITGINFSNSVLAELRKGFSQRQDDQRQEQILKTILSELERSRSIELEKNPDIQGSPADLAWQLQYARVQLEFEPDEALKTLSQLALSPLGNAVKADLEAIKPGGVPLRKEPKTQDGWQRLGGVAINSGVSVLTHYPIKRWQKVLQSLLLLLTLGFSYLSINQMIDSRALKTVVRVNSEQSIRAGAALQMQEAEDWKILGKRKSLPWAMNIEPGNHYQLAYFYSDLASPIHTVDLGEITNDVEIQMSMKSEAKIDSSTAVGLVVVTNKQKQVLNNAKIMLRNGLYTQTVSAAKTLSLPVGTWEFMVETAQGIGSVWQVVEVKKDKKTTLVVNAHYFRDVLKTGGRGPRMVSVPAGKFNMGDSEGNSNEKPVHKVKLNAFAIGLYEVTFAEYDAFCNATGRDKPQDQGWGRGSQPAINVSWEDAIAYANWLTKETGVEYRLPTEAEWEYVARAGTETVYWWGNEASHNQTNYGKEECCDGWVEDKDMWFYTAPVGSFSANPFGIYDMAGNVWEWTNDWYDGNYYKKSPIENPGGPDASTGRVYRGGGWRYSARFSRSASRGRSIPGYRSSDLGFRLARTDPRAFNPFTLEQKKISGLAPYTTFSEPLKQGGNSPVMIFLPGGNFEMGGIQGVGGSDERPVHQVTLNAFAIGQNEITNGQFVTFLNTVNRRGISKKPWLETQDQDASSRISGRIGHYQVEPGYENHPVNNVSWYGAKVYADWLSKQVGAEYRLLTEAEWEYAARAGSKTAYHFGNGENQLVEYAWYRGNSGNEAHKVGQKNPNQWGLNDIHGNVWEWVQDWYGEYSSDPQQNPVGPKKGSIRVFRGGSWDGIARYSRSAYRRGNDPDIRYNDLGLRLARTVSLPFYPITLAQERPELKPKVEEPEQLPYKPFNDTLKDGSPAPEIILIPGGHFTMGDIQGVGEAVEQLTHEVTVSDFIIGKYEVTVGEFQRYIEDTGYKTKAESSGSCWVWDKKWINKKGASWKNPGFKQSDHHPVACISWQDAVTYTEWLGAQTGKEYRLLTEAEWEYAARAGSKTAYHFGNDEKQLTAYGWYADNSEKRSHQVGQKKPNQWGVNDMHGNVWEWVQDWHGNYSGDPKVNPGGAKNGSNRVIRGGGWFNSARGSRSANRDGNYPDNRHGRLGFRLARKP